MFKDSKVSIIITTYNQAPYLGEAIASALGQSHRNLEIFVIDDGSTDGSEEVAARFS
ncbi:MAG: glycosyltransferase, partial [Pyrinomonas methylaliphatogenes]|nr:glycosyltransferase [Pyrinomonas methylaliphatogenes]